MRFIIYNRGILRECEEIYLKKKMIFVATSTVNNKDGYTSRIIMEMSMLHNDFELYLLKPGLGNSQVEFGNNVNVVEYPVCKNKHIQYIKNYFSFRDVLLNLIDNNDDTIICGESLLPSIKSCFVLRNKANKMIFDCHGTQADEWIVWNPGIKGKIISRILRKLEKWVVYKSDLIITVTNNQYTCWKKKKGNHIVLPMLPSDYFFDTHNYRDKIRREIGFSDEDIVFVYSGGNQKWQMCKETIYIFKLIQTRIKNAKLMILSTKTEYFLELLKENQIDNAIVKSISYEEMPQYLDACDYGFCIRENNIINHVASPTKVLEYLSRNVKPILSPYVGEFSTILPQNNLACVVDLNNMDSEININKSIDFNGAEYIRKLVKKKEEEYIDCISNLI